MPKHKELFADDYYDKDDLENPYENKMNQDDHVGYDTPTVRNTKTGILTNYKK